MPNEHDLVWLQQQLVHFGFLNETDVELQPNAALESQALRDAIAAIGEQFGDALNLGERDFRERIDVLDTAFQRRQCGVPDRVAGGLQTQTFGVPGGRWPRRALTFTINPAGAVLVNSRGEQQHSGKVTTIIATAFRKWQDAVPGLLSFTPIDRDGDIKVQFGGKELDKDLGTPGGTLGVAQYPGTGLGRVMLDKTERWTKERLLSLVLHEIGHAIGLAHSNNTSSVMYPFVPEMVDIDDESKEALRRLYAWPSQKQLADRATSDRPALAAMGQLSFTSATLTVHMVWKGSGSDQRIYQSKLNGDVWSPQEPIPNMASSDTPALTSLKMGDSTIGLLMAWKGIRDHQALFYSRNSGQGWTPQEEIRGSGSSHRPALADVGSERAFMAWKGIRDHQAIFWSTFDGRAWAPQQEIAGIGTSDSPALVGYKDRLHMFWKGVAGDGAL